MTSQRRSACAETKEVNACAESARPGAWMKMGKNKVFGKKTWLPAMLVAGLLIMNAIHAVYAEDEDEDDDDDERPSDGVRPRETPKAPEARESDDEDRSSSSVKDDGGGSAASSPTSGEPIVRVLPTQRIMLMQNATTDPKVVEFLDGLLAELMSLKAQQERQDANMQAILEELKALKSREAYLAASQEFKEQNAAKKDMIEKAAYTNVYGGEPAANTTLGGSAPSGLEPALEMPAAETIPVKTETAASKDERPWFIRFFAILGIVK
ncbi:MAG: hypothetical protein V1875_05060 [Candidatus Altiarchaeota archaeon]